MKEIGPDLGDGEYKWSNGVMIDSGIIYGIPYSSDKVLKINTNVGDENGNVTTIDATLPEEGGWKWRSGAISRIDGCIYCMPEDAKRILKINPANDLFQQDLFESVGEFLGHGTAKFRATIADENGMIYGMPYRSKQIIKIDPTNPDSKTNVGKKVNKFCDCRGGVLGMDGNIYSSNNKGDILIINVAKGSYSWILNTLPSTHNSQGWGDPIVGMDECIYWPPLNANRVMRLNIITQVPEFVGDDLGHEEYKKWNGGALASNGMIYCIPRDAKQVLAMDTRPISEVSVGQSLLSDNDDGPDHLRVEIMAHELGEYLASASLEPPFALGIIGKWGTGKSYFFNLIEWANVDEGRA